MPKFLSAPGHCYYQVSREQQVIIITAVKSVLSFYASLFLCFSVCCCWGNIIPSSYSDQFLCSFCPVVFCPNSPNSLLLLSSLCKEDSHITTSIRTQDEDRIQGGTSWRFKEQKTWRSRRNKDIFSTSSSHGCISFAQCWLWTHISPLPHAPVHLTPNLFLFSSSLVPTQKP